MASWRYRHRRKFHFLFYCQTDIHTAYSTPDIYLPMNKNLNGIFRGSANASGRKTNISRDAGAGLKFDGVFRYVDSMMPHEEWLHSPYANSIGVSFARWPWMGYHLGKVIILQSVLFHQSDDGYYIMLSNGILRVMYKFGNNDKTQIRSDWLDPGPLWVWMCHPTQGIKFLSQWMLH